MSIRLVLLKSGEDVIADVTEMNIGETRNVVGYFLENPCVVKIYKGEEESSIKIRPWAPLSKDKKIPVPADWVVTIVEPVDQLLELYTESLEKHGKPQDPGAAEPDFTESD